MSSAEPQMSRARVYHTAMNAAPRQRQIKKPSSAPSHILKSSAKPPRRKRKKKTEGLEDGK
jgi:hypothetical protein